MVELAGGTCGWSCTCHLKCCVKMLQGLYAGAAGGPVRGHAGGRIAGRAAGLPAAGELYTLLFSPTVVYTLSLTAMRRCRWRACLRPCRRPGRWASGGATCVWARTRGWRACCSRSTCMAGAGLPCWHSAAQLVRIPAGSIVVHARQAGRAGKIWWTCQKYLTALVR